MGNYVRKAAKRRKTMLYIYMVFLGILSLSIIVMAIEEGLFLEKQIETVYFSSFLLWTGIIGTIFMAIKINKHRKNSIRFRKQYENIHQLGLVCFFKNKPAIVADVFLIISLLGVALTVWRKYGDFKIIIPAIFLSIFIFSFGMHCMLNGINYIYMNEL